MGLAAKGSGELIMSNDSIRVAPIRRSKATNAYDLLDDVCKVIAEEPKRYDQNRWGVTGWRARRIYPAEELPACGTVGCRAGWIVALTDGRQGLDRAVRRFDVRDTAIRILGVKPSDVRRLFDASSVRNELCQGTPEYAAAGVRGLRRFMRKHRARLKRRSFTRG